jgi:hypothetical protein
VRNLDRIRIESKLSPGQYTGPIPHDKADDKPPTLRNTASRETPAQIGQRTVSAYQASSIHNVPVIFVRFGEQQMKKILASLVAASVALISVQAMAQEASGAEAAAPAASAPAKTKAKKQHKKLKHHGKRAPVQEGASAAGTNDTGTQQ